MCGLRRFESDVFVFGFPHQIGVVYIDMDIYILCVWVCADGLRRCFLCVISGLVRKHQQQNASLAKIAGQNRDGNVVS